MWALIQTLPPCRQGPCTQKPPRKIRRGVTAWTDWDVQQIQPTKRPTEYRCYIKEVIHYGQRVRRSYRGQSPSSVTQLPILTALHAGSSTLFGLIIHDAEKKVNTLFLKYQYFFPEKNQLGFRILFAPVRERPRLPCVRRGSRCALYEDAKRKFELFFNSLYIPFILR